MSAFGILLLAIRRPAPAGEFETGGLGGILRSVVLTMIGYVSLAIAFVPTWIVLCLTDGEGAWPRIIAGIYQSVRTLTSAGPESDPPRPLTAAAKVLASVEMLLGIYFVAVIIASYLSLKPKEEDHGPTR